MVLLRISQLTFDKIRYYLYLYLNLNPEKERYFLIKDLIHEKQLWENASPFRH